MLSDQDPEALGCLIWFGLGALAMLLLLRLIGRL